MEQFDVIVVGAGPAGLSAGLYSARRALKTLVLGKELGGQAGTTPEIENYPGVDFTDGWQLMEKFQAQAEKHGADVRAIEVEGLSREADLFVVKTPQESFLCRAVILAFGLTPRDLGVPGEEEFKGRGVSYCVTCDGPLYKGKKVAVAGGGNHALEAAEFLSTIASEVTIVYERDRFRGSADINQRVMNNDKITKALSHQITAVVGDKVVTGIKIASSPQKEIAIDGLFVEAGYIANTKWLADLVELDEHRQIKTDKKCHTSAAGIFAAGDITDEDYKQVVISAGQGAKAALETYKYLANIGLNKPIIPDWGFTKK